MADALLHSNRCFCGARVPITTGPREWCLDRAEIARLLLIPAAYSFQLRRQRSIQLSYGRLSVTERVPQSKLDRGYAATREDAMAAFKAVWERE